MVILMVDKLEMEKCIYIYIYTRHAYAYVHAIFVASLFNK